VRWEFLLSSSQGGGVELALNAPAYLTGASSMAADSTIVTSLGVGVHFLSVAAGAWMAAAFRVEVEARAAVALAIAVCSGLMCLVPLSRVLGDVADNATLPSLLLVFGLVFAGWVLYAIPNSIGVSQRRSSLTPERT
jgi:hypothetical protein